MVQSIFLSAALAAASSSSTTTSTTTSTATSTSTKPKATEGCCVSIKPEEEGGKFDFEDGKFNIECRKPTFLDEALTVVEYLVPGVKEKKCGDKEVLIEKSCDVLKEDEDGTKETLMSEFKTGCCFWLSQVNGKETLNTLKNVFAGMCKAGEEPDVVPVTNGPATPQPINPTQGLNGDENCLDKNPEIYQDYDEKVDCIIGEPTTECPKEELKKTIEKNQEHNWAPRCDVNCSEKRIWDWYFLFSSECNSYQCDKYRVWYISPIVACVPKIPTIEKGTTTNSPDGSTTNSPNGSTTTSPNGSTTTSPNGSTTTTATTTATTTTTTVAPESKNLYYMLPAEECPADEGEAEKLIKEYKHRHNNGATSFGIMAAISVTLVSALM